LSIGLEQCFPKFFARGPVLVSEKTTDPYTFAHVTIRCPGDTYAKLKIYISEMILVSYEYTPVAYVNNTLQDLTLIKITVARFVGTGCLLLDVVKEIRNKHIAKKLRDEFLKQHHSFN
jgi:hypothetical protein